LLVVATFALLAGGSVAAGEAVALPRCAVLLGAGLTSLPGMVYQPSRLRDVRGRSELES
jgi:hypothetical protein